MHTDCIILGGGAAGLTAAAALASSGLRVTIVERLDRVGKKILSTGNGRCNLSNSDMRAKLYAPCDGFVEQVYQATSPQDVLAFFDQLGLMTAEEDGRIYPRSMMRLPYWTCCASAASTKTSPRSLAKPLSALCPPAAADGAYSCKAAKVFSLLRYSAPWAEAPRQISAQTVPAYAC